MERWREGENWKDKGWVKEEEEERVEENTCRVFFLYCGHNFHKTLFCKLMLLLNAKPHTTHIHNAHTHTHSTHTAFEALNVKSLDEIRTEKLHSTQPPGHPHRIYIPTKKPSFELGSVLEETGIMKAQSNSKTSSLNKTQKHSPAQGTMAVVQTKNIFPGSQDTSSIFSREYRGSVSKDDVEKSSKPQTKQDVNNISSPDKKWQSGGHSNKSTPAQEPKTQVTVTMTSVDQETLQQGKVSGKAASQAGQKRSLVAKETKREQPVAKKVCVQQCFVLCPTLALFPPTSTSHPPCHSCDRCSQAFPIFYRSSAFMCYTEHKPKNKKKKKKNGGGLGTKLPYLMYA